jgi:hypothetical protein
MANGRRPNADGFPKPAANGFPSCIGALSRKAGGLGPPSLRYGCDKAGDFQRFPIISPISIISAKNHMRYHIRFGIKIKGITQITRFADEFLRILCFDSASSSARGYGGQGCTKVPIVPIISIQVSGFEFPPSLRFGAAGRVSSRGSFANSNRYLSCMINCARSGRFRVGGRATSVYAASRRDKGGRGSIRPGHAKDGGRL